MLSLWTLLVVFQPVKILACDDEVLNIIFNGKSTFIKVEIADTYFKRKSGLMFRESLAPNSGMLFVYRFPRKIAFWMKNTSISLDIAFADSGGTVKRVVNNTKPLSKELIHGGNDIQYVLEVNAGASEELNLFEQAKLVHNRINSKSGNSC